MDKVHIYLDKAGEPRWRRVAPNGNIVSSSGEDFSSPDAALVAATREAGDDAEVVVDPPLELQVNA